MRYFTHVNTILFAMDAAINWAAALLARLVRYFALYFLELLIFYLTGLAIVIWDPKYLECLV